jgi:hypothetical protein
LDGQNENYQMPGRPLHGCSARAAERSPRAVVVRFAIIGGSDYGFRGKDRPNINAA